MKLKVSEILYNGITPDLDIKNDTVKLVANLASNLHIFPNKTVAIKTGIYIEAELFEYCICNPNVLISYPTYLSSAYNNEVVVLITNYTESTIKVAPNQHIADLVVLNTMKKESNVKKVSKALV
jgi:dUTPase